MHYGEKGPPPYGQAFVSAALVVFAAGLAVPVFVEIASAQPKIVTSTSKANEIHGMDLTPKRFTVRRPGDVRKPSKKGRRYPSLIKAGRIIDLINAHSEKYKVDPKLIYALIEQESRFNRFAVSPKGAAGLMQIMPATQKELGLADPFDAEKNMDAGVRYLKAMLDRFETETLALAAYNAGPEAVDKYNGVPPYKETRDYVLRVVDRYFFLRLRYPAGSIGDIYASTATSASSGADAP